MSGRRRAFIAVVAGVTLAGVFATRVMRARPARHAVAANVETAPPAVAATAAPLAPALVPAANPGAGDSAGAPLTPDGAARALQAIGRNEQTRLLFARLLATGLSREQQNQVVLILGTAALRPPAQSPTVAALRADGHSQALSPDQGKRIIDERKRASDQSVRALRPALAAVLTPAQLAKAGLGDDLARNNR